MGQKARGAAKKGGSVNVWHGRCKSGRWSAPSVSTASADTRPRAEATLIVARPRSSSTYVR